MRQVSLLTDLQQLRRRLGLVTGDVIEFAAAKGNPQPDVTIPDPVDRPLRVAV